MQRLTVWLKYRAGTIFHEEAMSLRIDLLQLDLPERVDVTVNYDGFRLDEELTTAWASMVAGLQEKFYNTVTRYSGSAFMRMKLGETFPDARSHIFETQEQARAFLERFK